MPAFDLNSLRVITLSQVNILSFRHKKAPCYEAGGSNVIFASAKLIRR